MQLPSHVQDSSAVSQQPIKVSFYMFQAVNVTRLTHGRNIINNNTSTSFSPRTSLDTTD
jgi:hypothetical protein